MSGPHVWYRSDYQDVESYSYTLSPADIQELASAVAEVQRQGIELKVRVAVEYIHTATLFCSWEQRQQPVLSTSSTDMY